ncbi:ABC transporter ATP-binding protein [Streptomyces solincola]|uniref:ABC transporter ATP-binding protein n=1 Tax=Streptomyces solincola TaxID=2100817 RepID=A0A2S9PSB8_9ACTN|nr:ABC transporter ATP-binding protein [Streptomyces solincola]PRH77237.1 ABC transporter ATP-binding protein [Streptomyces solincola]
MSDSRTPLTPGVGKHPDAAVLTAVVKRFTTAKGEKLTAVDGMDLRLRRGEAVAFLGPNGAGKSTTVDMLLGLTTPDQGRVTVFGQEPRHAVRDGQVGAVLQSGGLLPDLTVGATLRMLGSLHPGADPERTMDRAGVTALRDRKVGACSGGEQQRIRFAIALLSAPQLLLLDEPTAGMDVTARRAFWAAVREETRRGVTVLFATHYMEEADLYADRVVMVDRGRVIADGSASSLRTAISGRTVSARLSPTDAHLTTGSPLVRRATVRGDRHHLETGDSDALLRLLVNETSATAIEVAPRSLEETFVALTSQAETTGRTTR